VVGEDLAQAEADRVRDAGAVVDRLQRARELRVTHTLVGGVGRRRGRRDRAGGDVVGADVVGALRNVVGAHPSSPISRPGRSRSKKLGPMGSWKLSAATM